MVGFRLVSEACHKVQAVWSVMHPVHGVPPQNELGCLDKNEGQLTLAIVAAIQAKKIKHQFTVNKFLIIALPAQHFPKWVTGHISKPALNYAYYAGTT